jgi:hypothetical protein
MEAASPARIPTPTIQGRPREAAPPADGGQLVATPEPSFARLETAPDVGIPAARDRAGAPHDAEGYRFLAHRMRLSGEDLEETGGLQRDKAPAHLEPLPPSASLVAFRREPTPPPREANLLQRLAGLMRGRREA